MIGAELGVFRGHFAAVIAECLQSDILYLVDPWSKVSKTFGWGEDSMCTGFGKLTTEYAKQDTIDRMRQFNELDIRIVEAYLVIFF